MDTTKLRDTATLHATVPGIMKHHAQQLRLVSTLYYAVVQEKHSPLVLDHQIFFRCDISSELLFVDVCINDFYQHHIHLILFLRYCGLYIINQRRLFAIADILI